jgi:hypothetical protein
MTVGIPTPPPPARRDRSARLLVAVGLIAIVVIGALVAWWQTLASADGAADAERRPSVAALDDTTARPPQGVRVRIRVVNTTGVTGLARRATQHLRDYGFDVVDFTSGRIDKNADSRIAVHTGHVDWAERVQKALGVGTIGNDADTSRYVDLTVFVGRDWRPPAETLRP